MKTSGRPDKRTAERGIYRRGPYSYVVRVRDADGRLRRYAAPTLDEARTIKAREVKAAHAGRRGPVAERHTTVQDFAAAFLTTYRGKTGGARDITLREYRELVERKLNGSRLGRQRISSVTQVDVEDFFAAVERSVPGGYSATYMRNLSTPVRAIFRHAVRQRIFERNPCDNVAFRTPKFRPELRTLDEEIVSALIAAFDEPRYQLAAKVLATCGLRISELSGLDQRDLHVTGGEAKIAVRQRVRGTEIGDPKSSRGRRQIPIPMALAAELFDHMTGLAWQDPRAPLFQTMRGARMTPAVFRRHFNRARMKTASAAINPDVQDQAAGATPHMFRHSAARRWRLVGVSDHLLSHLIGHSSTALTQAAYGAVLPQDLPSGELLALS